MTIENIERIYLSPATEHEAIRALRSDNEFSLVAESSTCFVFEKSSKNYFTLEIGER